MMGLNHGEDGDMQKTCRKHALFSLFGTRGEVGFMISSRIHHVSARPIRYGTYTHCKLSHPDCRTTAYNFKVDLALQTRRQGLQSPPRRDWVCREAFESRLHAAAWPSCAPSSRINKGHELPLAVHQPVPTCHGLRNYRISSVQLRWSNCVRSHLGRRGVQDAD
jgi:hypothetical protein